jgi:hypothetical protein
MGVLGCQAGARVTDRAVRDDSCRGHEHPWLYADF